MNKKRAKKKPIKFIFFLLCLISLIILLINVLSRYQSLGGSTGEIEVAYYLLNTDYQTTNINLFPIIPRAEPYIKTFSISNNDGINRTQTTIEYNLEIVTTTNLPLIYELYLNQHYNANDATNIAANTIEQDEHGTYFNKIKMDTARFGHSNNEANIYQLVIYFPEQYKSIEYQDIIESIEIKVDSKQVIE